MTVGHAMIPSERPTHISVPSGKVDLLLDTDSKLMGILNLGFLLLIRCRLGGSGTDGLSLEGRKINNLDFRIGSFESREVLGDVCAMEEDGCFRGRSANGKDLRGRGDGRIKYGDHFGEYIRTD